jgi:hypothetical protein
MALLMLTIEQSRPVWAIAQGTDLRLPLGLGGFPFPSRYVHPRYCLSGELAEN